MATFTKRDCVHIAVWQFFFAVHNGQLENLLNNPMYTHFENRVHLVPAMSIHQIQQLSGQSERVVSGTLETLTYEHVLWGIHRWVAWTKDQEYIGLSFDERSLFVPVLLPESPQIINTWPKNTLFHGPYAEDIKDAAETREEAREVWVQIVEMGLVDSTSIRKIIESVEFGDLSLKEAVEQASSQ
jgi:hypothetical protein